ncbi:hypothetical protein EVAR_62600_1 [Eumeta japonica]|uniref:Uncharacterized protein n=1 Tax=Eumeta variegata TaxID=151549 RepID=A0A4C1ZQC3_EUMVA|nr:hypothetical protein EVAR_62600_1 [Eumeta japonica]
MDLLPRTPSILRCQLGTAVVHGRDAPSINCSRIDASIGGFSSGCSTVVIGRLRYSSLDHPFSLVCYCVPVFLPAVFRSVVLRACMKSNATTAGANIEPILAKIVTPPTPTLRATVGYNSPVKRKSDGTEP